MSESNRNNGVQSHRRHARRTKCGARLRAERAGRVCSNWAMSNGRCRMHGGSTPSGIASPHFRHGRYSKVLAGGMLTAFQESLADPDLLELQREIALVDARVSKLLSSRPTGQAWDEIAGLIDTRRRLCDSAGRRAMWLGSYLPAERVFALSRGLAMSVRRHVRDPLAVRAIVTDMTALGLGPASADSAVVKTEGDGHEKTN